MSTELAEKRAHRGAKLFDKLLPKSWSRDIRLTSLKMHKVNQCAVAQVNFDQGGLQNYDLGMLALEELGNFKFTRGLQTYYGVNVSEWDHSVTFVELTEAWKNEIRARRAIV